MDYGDSVQKVLLRKLKKAEQETIQLRLDYCRFVFGLSRRTRVVADGQVYEVCSVDIDSMAYNADGTLTRPAVSGLPLGEGATATAEPTFLGTDWQLAPAQAAAAVR
ncbi:hypothetical protein [Marinobacter sp. C2H3]|uniref:hypothetical protein n=1 Tax=Marinobacter sp. C2H3 TaxID=3119003 RepID=UPI00300EE2F4